MKNKNARFQVFYNRKENRIERVIRHYNEIEIENFNLEKLLNLKDILYLLFCKIFINTKKEKVEIYSEEEMLIGGELQGYLAQLAAQGGILAQLIMEPKNIDRKKYQ